MKKLRKLFGVILIIVALVVMQLPPSEASAAATVSDFSIDREGVLTKYNGTSASVVIPDGVVTIATDAFKNNQRITSVVIPDSVKKIESYAFWNCQSLYSVTIGAGLDEIGDFSFANCKLLSSVFVPSNIIRIGIYAFQDDINLTDITIPPQTFFIHDTAFDGCKKLVIHAIEGTYAYKYAQEFYKRQQEFNEYEDVLNYTPSDIVINISDNTTDGTVNGDGHSDSSVTNDDVSDSPEANNTNDRPDSNQGNGLVSVDVSNPLSSVHIVGNKAVMFMDGGAPTVYYGNQRPTNVTDNADGENDGSAQGTGAENQTNEISFDGIPKFTIVDGETIADQAYYLSNKLSYVALPDTIKEIGQFAYARSSLSSIVLPDGLEFIDYGAFYHCDKLGSVTIPQTVKKIEPKAFDKSAWVDEFLQSGEGDFLISGGVLVAYKGNASQVVIPEGVRIIAAECFKGHEEISSVVFPESIESIGEEAFYGCTNLSSVNTEETNVSSILDRAFRDTMIKNVLMPVSLENEGLLAFPDDAMVSYEGSAPRITHEVSAERLSNEAYRVNVYDTGATDVLVNKGEMGVNVTGLEGTLAVLDGMQGYYYLNISPLENRSYLDNAVQRAGQAMALGGKELLPAGAREAAAYEFELTDESGINISKLGKTALAIAIPLPGGLEGKSLQIFTTDRNGQLEGLVPEIVNVSGVKYIRFSTYHLSPFVIYETGDSYDDVLILEDENVFTAMAGPEAVDTHTTQNIGEWFAIMKWRCIVAALLVATGFVLIFAKFKSKVTV